MSERLPNGRFAPGISANPNGRPKLPFDLTALIDSCVSETDYRNMIKTVKKKALRRDLKCVEWIFDRRFGTPIQRSEIAGADGKAMRIKVTLMGDD